MCVRVGGWVLVGMGVYRLRIFFQSEKPFIVYKFPIVRSLGNCGKCLVSSNKEITL